MVAQINELQMKKQQAVAIEDYDTAKSLKLQIDRLQSGDFVRLGNLDFFTSFLSSISMIIVSEIGDKTFFIAAIMAMRNNKTEVFFAAVAALALMTVLSAAMGFTLPNLLPRQYTHYAAALLFVFFGVKLLREAATMDPAEPNEELEEVETELAESQQKEKEMEEGGAEHKKLPFLRHFFSPVFIQCFSMTFLAEWGDRSQIATIALAAAKDPIGVTLGGIIGHSFCTGLAVVGGTLLSARISERLLTMTGGLLFLLFAIHSWYVGPDENTEHFFT